MLTDKCNKLSVIGVVAQLMNRTLLAVCLIVGSVSAVNASALLPFDGYNSDSNVTYFAYSPLVVGVELLDPLDSATTFGFYFKGDSSNLITIFDGSDSVGEQKTIIDFINGVVLDDDASAVETIFSITAGSIGFFLDVVGEDILFSDPLLNPNGMDLFSAFQNIDNPDLWAIVFEGIDPAGLRTPVNLNLIAGITAISEPSTVALFAIATLIMLFLSRRKLVELNGRA